MSAMDIIIQRAENEMDRLQGEIDRLQAELTAIASERDTAINLLAGVITYDDEGLRREASEFLGTYHNRQRALTDVVATPEDDK